MALDYTNFEIIDKIKRNLKGTAPKNKLTELEDKIQVSIPVCSANAPISTREQYSDFDSAPKNYSTISTGAQTAVAAVTWTTVRTVTPPAGSYFFIWGLNVSCEDLQDFDWILTTSNTDDSVTDTSVIASGHVVEPLTGCTSHNEHFSRPIMIPTGSCYIRVLNLDAANPHNFNGKFWYEVRRIENRDP